MQYAKNQVCHRQAIFKNYTYAEWVSSTVDFLWSHCNHLNISDLSTRHLYPPSFKTKVTFHRSSEQPEEVYV